MPLLQIYSFGFLQDRYWSLHYSAVFFGELCIRTVDRMLHIYNFEWLYILLKFHMKQIEIGLLNDVTLIQGDYKGQGHI